MDSHLRGCLLREMLRFSENRDHKVNKHTRDATLTQLWHVIAAGYRMMTVAAVSVSYQHDQFAGSLPHAQQPYSRIYRAEFETAIHIREKELAS